MPPEPSPWDRRDFRRSGTSDRNFNPPNNFSQRWRDQNNHHPYPPPSPYHRQQQNHHQQQQNNQQQQQRWYPDFRSSRPATPGHGKQGGGWQVYTDEPGNGYLPFGSRYGDRNNNNSFDSESNNPRSPFVSRGGNDGRYPRNNTRENRGWRTPSWEPSASPYNGGGGRPTFDVNNRRSVDRTQTPYVERTQTPYVQRTQTPYVERNQTPYVERNQTPYVERHQTPYVERHQTPYRSEFASPFTRAIERTGTPYNNVSNKETDFSHRSGFASPLIRPMERTHTPYNNMSNKDAGSSYRSEFASPLPRSMERTQTPYNNVSNKETDVARRSEVASPLPRSMERTQTPYNNVSNKETDVVRRSEVASPLPRSQNQSPSRIILKEQQLKEGGTAEECTGLSQKVEKENEQVSMDWKPLKWHRAGSLSSRSSGLSHSFSPKRTGVESVEVVTAVQTKSITPLQSPTEDAAVCVPAGSATPLEDMSSRKKPRLGWGQGLAKFEKKKVDGPEDCVMKDGEVDRIDNTETLQSHAVDVVDKSPTAVSLPDCASPATPSSVACSSSTGVEEKESIKSVNINNDGIKLTCSPTTMCQALYSGPAFNLETLESSITNLSTLINGTLHSCGPSSTDSGYMQSSMQNKLSVLKVDISKAIEATEPDIDSLETELKLLENAESGNSPYTASSSPRLEVCHVKPGEDQATTSKVNGDEVNGYTAGLSTVTSSQDLAISGRTHSDANDLCSIILASNKDCANRAMEELCKVLPANMNQFGISPTTSVSLLKGDPLTVEKKFVLRKRFLQFKEKVLSLRFRVFRHFWKEGRVLSVRSLRLKSHENDDLSNLRKNRSSRPRISFFSGTPQSVTADEVIEVVNNLLSMVPLKPCRNTIKMPSLILDKKEMDMSRFPSNNGLIIDPRGAEKERSTINPWTSEETEIFIDNLTTFGKDFKKISSFLEHKTTADCIEFYYKNHKSQLFGRAKKKLGSTKQRKPQSTTYLVASAKRFNREKNAASLDMLGAASAIAANVDGRMEIPQKCTSRFFLSPSSSSYKSPRGEDSERETVAADVLAGICGSISSEAMSSCITSSVDHGEVHHQARKYHRVRSLKKRPLTPEVTQSIDGVGSADSVREMALTEFTDEEISAFKKAVSSYGEDFVMISQAVGTRSIRECKAYFWKGKKRHEWHLIQPEFICSDTRDACDTEIGSVVCKEATDHSKPGIKICELNNRPSEIDSMATETVIYDSTVRLREMDDKVVSDLNMEDTEQNVENSSCEADKRVSEGNCREEREGKQILLTGNSSEASGVSGTVNEMKSDDLCGSHPYVANSSIQSGGKVSECQKKAYHEQISHVVPSVNSSKLFSVPIKYQTSPHHSSLSASGNNNVICYNKRPQNLVEANDSQKNLPVSASAETLQILTGHPVSMQTKTQINGDLNYKRSIPSQNIAKQNGIPHSDRFSLQKCNSLDQSRPLSSGSSDADRPHGNGDVKLFGKILKPSQPKLNCSREQDDQLCKPDFQSLNVSFNGDCKFSSDSSQSTFDVSNFTGSENVPVKSCSLWDGNMIQGGFSRLADSGHLLNKYPSAFGKCVLNLDQSSAPNSSNGVDMNQKQDVFSEMSRRLGFDVMAGLKQQANGMHVGGKGGGVSDPVAALKMHYPNAEQFSLRSGSIRKEDSWRSNGDLGR